MRTRILWLLLFHSHASSIFWDFYHATHLRNRSCVQIIGSRNIFGKVGLNPGIQASPSEARWFVIGKLFRQRIYLCRKIDWEDQLCLGVGQAEVDKKLDRKSLTLLFGNLDQAN
eukprot:TRINITY_DN3665_c0_g1_i5.p1 TRINITY_DN3665_c0_g1~~TRINITY_DN3665_c0_g1_i5.p1  ORF type:complete len:114 (-),score=8.13 TRINITY_DN3665_c0_g1_i5:10-351(-)